MCTGALSELFNIEARQLVNGVDNVVNASLKTSENLTSLFSVKWPMISETILGWFEALLVEGC